MNIEVPVKVKHVYRAKDYADADNCVLAEAFKDFFKTNNATEAVSYAIIDKIIYNHTRYTPVDHDDDVYEAFIVKDPEYVLRTIILTTIN